MFATLMIVLNGMVGAALLMGALRYWEQEYNLDRRACLPHGHRRARRVRADHPELHQDRARPEPGALQGLLFAVITVLFYIVFVVIQTMRHRAFFAEPSRAMATRHGVSPTRRQIRRRADRSGSMCCMLLLTLRPGRAAVGVSRYHRRFRHRGSRPARRRSAAFSSPFSCCRPRGLPPSTRRSSINCSAR